MGIVARGWVAYDLSHSAAAVGFVALAQGVPMLVFGLFGGVAADRFPKRSVLFVTQAIQAAAAIAGAILLLSGVMQVWHLALVGAVSGFGIAFNMPARHSFVAQLVPRERLVNAVALNMAGTNFARIVGPAVAGGLIAVPFVGAGGVFVLISLMFTSVIIRLLRIKHRGEPEDGPRASPLRSVADGLVYVRGNAVMRTLLLLAFVPVLLGMPYQQLMPVFAEEVFRAGPAGLGILMAANGVGALLGSLGIAASTGFRRRGLLQMILGMCFGGALTVFAFSPTFIVGMVALLFVGMASAGYQSLNNTLVINGAEPAYRGRVMGLYLLTNAASPLAIVPFGFLADAFGAPLTIGVAGLALLTTVSLVGLFHPTYRYVE